MLWSSLAAVMVGLSVASHLRSKGMREFKVGLLSLLAAVVAGAVVSGATGFSQGFVQSVINRPDPVEQAMRSVRETPFLRALVQHEPKAAARMRAALEREFGLAGANVPGEVARAGRELFREYAYPAFRASSDAHILAIWKARGELVNYLHSVDRRSCRRYVVQGTVPVQDLDKMGLGLFLNAMRAQEEAYLDGRRRPVRPETTDERLRMLFGQLKLSDAEIHALQSVYLLVDADACAAGRRLYAGTYLLPLPERAELARYMITTEE